MHPGAEPGVLRIGPHVLGSRAVLAPMAGVTDAPFRALCRAFGAGLAAAEMLSADMNLWHTPKSRRRMDPGGEPSPRVVQLAGADPAALAAAARAHVARGAEIIDLNMGCPAKKVCGKLCGSALLRDEELVARILDAVVAAVDVPVTCKIRTGWDREQRNGVRIAEIAAAAGVAALAVHGRTRADFYTGSAEYATIREIKSRVRIPVFANGDIDTPHKARAVLDFTGADGVMIGRASHGAPWIFRAVNLHLAAIGAPPPLLRGEVRDIILAHLDSLYRFYGEELGVRIARKHLGWYCGQLLQDATSVRRELLAATDTGTQFASAARRFGDWAGAAVAA